MNCEDLNKYLEDFIDGSLPQDLHDDFEDSIRMCPEVEEQLYLYKKLFRSINQLPLGFDPPTTIVFRFTSNFRKTAEEEFRLTDGDKKEDQKKRALEKKIKELSGGKKAKQKTKLEPINIFKNKLFLSVAVPVLLIFSFYYFFFLANSGIWDIAIDKGSYEINNLASFNLELNKDDILSTYENSNITIYVGSDATVELGSNSTIKVVNASRSDNQMEFINGSIIFNSTAEDHNFLISHRSLIVEDLSSTYEMQLQDDGSIYLNVINGKIKIVLPNDEMLLRHDYNCRVFNSQKIVLPVFFNASNKFINSLEKLNDNLKSYESLTEVLNEAQREDALTLLRILEIMPTSYRGMVYKKLDNLFPMPTWVTKVEILRLDRTALTKWWENIEWQL